jgi:hypothetical protein
MFVVQKFILTNNEKHNLDTRQRNNLYLPQAHLITYPKGVYYLEIKFFNNLPLEIKNVAGNQKKLKIALKKILWRSALANHELCNASKDFIVMVH